MALSEEEKRLRHNASQKRYLERKGNAANKEYQKKTGYAAQAKYKKNNTRTYSIQFSYNTDGDLIEYLESKENRNGYIRDLVRADMQSLQRTQGNRIIPLFGNAFAAGIGEPDFGNAFEDYEVPATQRGDFAVRINGDSMEPYLPDGSIQFGIKGMPRDGEVAAIMVDGAFYVKQVVIDFVGNLHLLSLNRARKDADFTVWKTGGNNVSCFGTILMRERVPLPLDV